MTAPVPADVRAAAEAMIVVYKDNGTDIEAATAALAAADRVRANSPADIGILAYKMWGQIYDKTGGDPKDTLREIVAADRTHATLILSLRAQLAAAVAERDAARETALREAAEVCAVQSRYWEGTELRPEEACNRCEAAIRSLPLPTNTPTGGRDGG